MANRSCEKPAWQIAAKHDMRRGLWFRLTDTQIEICAGREGDDCYLTISKSELAPAKWEELRSALQSASWARLINELPLEEGQPAGEREQECES